MTQDTQTITIYTHPDCDASAGAKADFDRDGIAYKEIDVTLVEGAIDELLKLTGGERITPVVVDGEMVIVGYGGVG
ncbi:MAG: glutaredoxin family protein [Dehalococcoidia bacterium]